MTFYNRTRELNAINKRLASNQAELMIVYGRRGSGKSKLLTQAIVGHNAFYYQASARLLPQLLAGLTDELRRVAGSQAFIGQLNSIDDLFTAVTTLAQKNPQQPFIFVIDEFPYFVEAANPGTETVVQKWWDMTHESTPNLKMFLCGSHVSWMRERLISGPGPLQNRRTAQLEVRPLAYYHAAEFYPNWTAQEKVRAYGIWGGLPRYLNRIDPNLGLWENIGNALLDPESYLFAEPDWLRFTDLRADDLYTSIVQTIAMGKSLPSEIAKAVGRQNAADIFEPLNRLVDMGIVARVTALNYHKGRYTRTLYRLADPFLNFWYRFIDSLRSVLQQGKVESAQKQIQQTIDEYIGRYVFEDVCRQWVWIADERGYLPAHLGIVEVGTWWGGTKSEQDEIDVVALPWSREAILFGECKWSNSPMDLHDLGGLRHAIDKSRVELNPVFLPWRVCFSRSSFHPDLIAEASNPENRIVLIEPDQLYQ